MCYQLGGNAKAALFLALACIVLAGCSTPFPVYSISATNVETIRSIPAKIEVSQFSGSQDQVSCRLQPIVTETGETFASYIRNAMNSELIIANTSPTASGKNIVLSGTLKTIDVDCGILSGDWTIEMDLSVNGGAPFTVRTVHKFDGNYFGAVVFSRALQAFVPSIQDFVADVLRSPSVQAAAGRQ